MLPPVLYKALGGYADLYQRIETIPISWDKKRKKFVYNINHFKLACWYFTMSLVFFGTCCSLYICLKKILLGSTNAPNIIVLIHLFAGLMGGPVGCGGAIIMLMFGPDFVLVWNYMQVIENFVVAESGYPLKPRPVYNIAVIFITLFILIFPLLFSIVGTIGIIWLNLDPFYYVFQDWFRSHIFFTYTFTMISLRYVLTVICLFEFFRIFCFGLAVACGFVHFTGPLMQQILNAKFEMRIVFQAHDIVKILMSSAYTFTDIIIAGALFLAQISGVLACYGTFAAREVLPMPFYLLEPFVAVFILIGFQLIFIPLSHMHEGSIEWIHSLSLIPLNYPAASIGSGLNARKFVRRKLRILRTFTFYAGVAQHKLFACKKSTEVTFYNSMVTFTISALLAVPKLHA